MESSTVSKPPRANAGDRSRMRTVANNAILHLHPTRVPARALRFTYTWGLGGMCVVLAIMLVLTGVMLMFRYEPSVERAYISVQALETQVAFGSLVRGVHHWSANMLVVTTFLHLVRVFLTGGYKNKRSTNWLIGVGLLVLVLAFNFTGYLLPWDQLAYWAITVSTSLISYLPLVGPQLSDMLLGGPEVGQVALNNFYALHVAVLPVLLALTMAYHFWRVRKDGGISQPKAEGDRPSERVTTIPHLVRREFAVAAITLTGMVLFAMLQPAPLGELANPTALAQPGQGGVVLCRPAGAAAAHADPGCHRPGGHRAAVHGRAAALGPARRRRGRVLSQQGWAPRGAAGRLSGRRPGAGAGRGRRILGRSAGLVPRLAGGGL